MAEISLSDVMLSELTLEPIFVPSEPESTSPPGSLAPTPQRADHPLSVSAISMPRLVLPTLPDGQLLLEPEPSLPGTAWSVSLAEELLFQLPSRAAVTVVMPGEWVTLGGRMESLADEVSTEIHERLEQAKPQETEGPSAPGATPPDDLKTLDLQEPEQKEGADWVSDIQLEAVESLEPVDLIEPPALGEPSPPLAEGSTRRSLPPKSPPASRPSLAAEVRRSPTIRAVMSTLRDEASAQLAEPRGNPRARVFLELDDPTTIQDVPPQLDDKGTDSVWLELGASDESTALGEVPQRPPPEGVDAVADGGAVRVDLSLGSDEAPDLDSFKASVEDPTPVRSWVGDSSRDLKGRTTDLVALSRARVDTPVGVGPLEDEPTLRGPALEERITDDGWADGLGNPGNRGDQED